MSPMAIVHCIHGAARVAGKLLADVKAAHSRWQALVSRAGRHRQETSQEAQGQLGTARFFSPVLLVRPPALYGAAAKARLPRRFGQPR